MMQRVTMLRSIRVALLVAIQNFSQLDALYGERGRTTILTNTTTHLVLPGVGQEEAEYYSRRIGSTTVYHRSQAASLGETIHSKSASSSRGTSASMSETARRLILPEEIRTMTESTLLLLADTSHPIVVRTTPYYEDTNLVSKLRPVPAIQGGRRTAPEPPPPLPVPVISVPLPVQAVQPRED